MRAKLLSSLEERLGRLAQDEALRVRTRFLDRLDGGGEDALHAISSREEIHSLQLPIVAFSLTQRFVEVEAPRLIFDPAKLDRAAKLCRKASAKLKEAAVAIRSAERPGGDLIDGLADLFANHADFASASAEEALESRGSPGPGRYRRPETALASDLDEILQLGDALGLPAMSEAERLRLIAPVVSAFIEPVSTETLRQRLKHFARRPPRSPQRRR